MIGQIHSFKGSYIETLFPVFDDALDEEHPHIPHGGDLTTNDAVLGPALPPEHRPFIQRIENLAVKKVEMCRHVRV